MEISGLGGPTAKPEAAAEKGAAQEPRRGIGCERGKRRSQAATQAEGEDVAGAAVIREGRKWAALNPVVPTS
eukprot:1629022-Pleurochrysis_carterae.AAC.2